MKRFALPAALVAVAVAAAGCSSSGKPAAKATSAPPSSPVVTPPPATSASTPASTPASAPSGGNQFADLLIAPSDLGVPGARLTGTQAAPGGLGVVGLFQASGNRALGDTIVVLPSADAAHTAYTAAASAAGNEVAGATAHTVPLGDGGEYLAGTSNGQAVTLVLFTEGKAFVTMEFRSPANDPVPVDLARTISLKQDAKIKANPPS